MASRPVGLIYFVLAVIATVEAVLVPFEAVRWGLVTLAVVLVLVGALLWTRR